MIQTLKLEIIRHVRIPGSTTHTGYSVTSGITGQAGPAQGNPLWVSSPGLQEVIRMLLAQWGGPRRAGAQADLAQADTVASPGM